MANGGRQIPGEDVLADLIVDQFLAQQDVTRVRDPREEQPQMGELENLIMNLIQGADPTMGIASGIAGLTPDDPDFRTQLGIGLLTGGSLLRLLKAGGQRAVAAAGRIMGRAADPAGAAKASDEAVGAILDQIGVGGRKAAGTQAEDLASIRSGIFRDLKREDPFGDVAAARGSAQEGAEALARRRATPGLTREDFNVSESVDDALDRLRRGAQGLREKDEIDRILRRTLDDLFGN